MFYTLELIFDTLAFTFLLASSVAPAATHRALLGFAERLASDIADVSQAHADKKSLPVHTILAAVARTLVRLLFSIVLFTLIVVNEVVVLRRLGIDKLIRHPSGDKTPVERPAGTPQLAAGSSDNEIAEEKAADSSVKDPVVALRTSDLIARRSPNVAPLKIYSPAFNVDEDDDDDDDDEFEALGHAVRAIRPPTPPSRVCMPEDEDVIARPNIAVRAVRPLSPPMRVSRSSSSASNATSSRSVPSRTLSSPVTRRFTQFEPETQVVRPVNKRDSAPAFSPLFEPSHVNNEGSMAPVAVVPAASASPAVPTKPLQCKNIAPAPAFTVSPVSTVPDVVPAPPVHAEESKSLVVVPTVPPRKPSLSIDLPTPPVSPSTSTASHSIQPVPTRSTSSTRSLPRRHSGSLSNLAQKIAHTFDHCTSSDSDGWDEKEGKKTRGIRPFGSHKDGEARGTRTVKRLMQKLKGDVKEAED